MPVRVRIEASMGESGLFPKETQPEPQQAAPHLGEQILGVFTKPVELFQQLRKRPVFVGALVLTLVFTMAMMLSWGLNLDKDAFFRTILERSGSPLDSDQMDRIVEIQKKFLLPGGLVGSLIGIPLISVFLAWVFYLVGKKAADEPPSYLQSLSATVVPGLATIPTMLLISLFCWIKEVGILAPERMTPTSLGFFLESETPKLQGLYNGLELFGFIHAVLLCLALQHLLGYRKNWAISGAVIFFLLSVGMKVLGAK